jgi:transforming growth factor-beta-induced protein
MRSTFVVFFAAFFFQAAVVHCDLYNIVQTAINNGNFKTLVVALQAGGLVPTLEGPGPFTVFAPTDAAFAKLPPGTIAELLKPENKQKLIHILLYHGVAGNFTAAAIIALNPPVRVPTLAGESVLVTKDGNNLKVNDATVIIADVFATNGIIHAIDTVLLPRFEAETDIVDTAIANGNFKTLVTALTAGSLVDTLKGPGPFTVFAPTDAAFAKLPPGVIANLLKPENKRLLVEILEYHVVAGNFTSQAIIAKGLPARIETLNGRSVYVTLEGTTLRVNDASVIIPNVFATNGIIHAVDTVLLPRRLQRFGLEAALANKN